MFVLAIIGCEKRMPALSETEARIIGDYRSGLMELAHVSATADSILHFYDASVVLGRELGGGHIQLVQGARTPNYFIIYAAQDTVPHPSMPSQFQVIASFSFNSRTLALGDNRLSTRVKGLFLAHELRHAYDCLSGIEAASDSLSDEWLLGEMRSHATIFQILNETTHSRYAQCTAQSQAERESLAIAHGYRPTSFTFDSVPGDSTRLARVFGPISPDDRMFYATQLTVDANMHGIMKFSPDDATQRRGSLMFLGEMYNPKAKRFQIDVHG
jgi:hypothetical protein